MSKLDEIKKMSIGDLLLIFGFIIPAAIAFNLVVFALILEIFK